MPSPPRRASTAKRSATCACSSASRSSKCPRARPNGSSRASVAPRFAVTCCESSPPGRRRFRGRRLRRMSTALMNTTHGTIELELFDEDAPKTVANFRKLAGDGFYDGVIFHRVIPDFMIQGGCPQGIGTGGPGYTFEDEFNDHKIVRGALAMANAGPNTNGSQFFIVTIDAAPWLNGKHTVFGQVTAGMDAVDAIEGLPTGARDRPVDPPQIESIELDPQ